MDPAVGRLIGDRARFAVGGARLGERALWPAGWLARLSWTGDTPARRVAAQPHRAGRRGIRSAPWCAFGPHCSSPGAPAGKGRADRPAQVGRCTPDAGTAGVFCHYQGRAMSPCRDGCSVPWADSLARSTGTRRRHGPRCFRRPGFLDSGMVCRWCVTLLPAGVFWGQPNDRTLVDGHGTVTAIVDQRRHAGVGDDDATLLERLRAGDVEPYAELWRRHLASAYRVAHRYRGRASAEDIVGEASLRVFDRIQAGDGPTSNFRGYFLTVVKSVALDLGKADLRLVPTDGAGSGGVPLPRCRHTMPRVAWTRIWSGWRSGGCPCGISKCCGTPRCREHLRPWSGWPWVCPPMVSALPRCGLETPCGRLTWMRTRTRRWRRTRSTECRWVLSQMGRYVRGKLGAKRRARVERHLQHCTTCAGCWLPS